MGLQMFGTRENDRNLDGIRLPCKMEVIDSFGHYSLLLLEVVFYLIGQ